MIKGYKIRIYPTKEQEQKMWNHIGCCRYIWNYMLDIQIKRYENKDKHLSGFDMINLLKPLKNDGEHDWLYNVSNTSLQIVCKDLNEAYKSLFKKIHRKPKFKSKKKSKPTFPVRIESVYFKDGHVNIEKIGKVKYKSDFNLPQGKGNIKVSNPRVQYILGKWILSFGMECENQTHVLNDISVGIDLGIKELAVVAHNNEQVVFHNINKSKKMRDISNRIKFKQRSISRKYEAYKKKIGKYEKTNNIIKEENKLKKLYAKQRNIRHNYIHQCTHKIISLLPYRVVMESLNVQGMMKNKHLSKAIGEQNFYEFLRQMKYKCEWNGIEFVQVDRFYPSSKKCSCCGKIKKDLKLKDRIFKCECGNEIDRDFNAALNLSRYVI